jgi:hypothetical protein
MLITLTTEQFNKYWYFIRKMVPIEHRQPMLKAVMEYRHLVDKNTTLEVEVTCGTK